MSNLLIDLRRLRRGVGVGRRNKERERGEIVIERRLKCFKY